MPPAMKVWGPVTSRLKTSPSLSPESTLRTFSADSRPSFQRVIRSPDRRSPGRPEPPFPQADRVVFGGQQGTPGGLNFQQRAFIHQDGFHQASNRPPFRVDGKDFVPGRQRFDGPFSLGSGNPGSGREAAPALVMDGHAADEKGMGLIGLEIINRDPFPDPLQGHNALFGQPLPVKSQNGCRPA